MQFSIVRRNGSLDDATREFAERRLLFALSRFGSKIDHVSAVIADVNGPRGGLDQSCRVTVGLGRLGTVTVTSIDIEAEPSVARAADRAGRLIHLPAVAVVR